MTARTVGAFPKPPQAHLHLLPLSAQQRAWIDRMKLMMNACIPRAARLRPQDQRLPRAAVRDVRICASCLAIGCSGAVDTPSGGIRRSAAWRGVSDAKRRSWLSLSETWSRASRRALAPRRPGHRSFKLHYRNLRQVNMLATHAKASPGPESFAQLTSSSSPFLL